jgi:nucleoside-diphosphate-sugar epimerase
MYGPGAKGNVAVLLRLAARRCPLPLGRFDNRRSLLALSNLIDAIIFALEHRATVGETYIIADDDALAMTEILATMQEAYGRRRLIAVPPKALELALRAMRQKEYWYRLGGNLVVSTGKLKGTGWRPKVDTRSGLADLISQTRTTKQRRERKTGGQM